MIGDKQLKDLTFIETLLIVIVGWILVNLWQKVIDTLAYNVLKMNPQSLLHVMIIAITTTIIFLSFVFSFDSISAGIIEQSVDKSLTPPVT